MNYSVFNKILSQTERYYDKKVSELGVCAAGVDWKSEHDQVKRFEQIAGLFKNNNNFSLIDYGCGYGAMVPYLFKRHNAFSYVGCDISYSMITHALTLYGDHENVEFIRCSEIDFMTDYCVSSGIFNVRQNVSDELWLEYLQSTLQMFNRYSRLGFSFNLLSVNCDPEKKRDDLFYADKDQIVSYCRRNFSDQVSVIDDYGLFEFTVYVER